MQALATGDIRGSLGSNPRGGRDLSVHRQLRIRRHEREGTERAAPRSPLARDERARQGRDPADPASGAVPPLELRERARRDSDLVFRVLS